MLLFPPIRFMAIASASCASWLMEPYDMAPVLNRARIASTGSTSSSGTAFASGRKSIRPRSVTGCFPCRLTSSLYRLKSL